MKEDKKKNKKNKRESVIKESVECLSIHQVDPTSPNDFKDNYIKEERANIFKITKNVQNEEENEEINFVRDSYIQGRDKNNKSDTNKESRKKKVQLSIHDNKVLTNGMIQTDILKHTSNIKKVNQILEENKENELKDKVEIKLLCLGNDTVSKSLVKVPT